MYVSALFFSAHERVHYNKALHYFCTIALGDSQSSTVGALAHQFRFLIFQEIPQTCAINLTLIITICQVWF